MSCCMALSFQFANAACWVRIRESGGLLECGSLRLFDEGFSRAFCEIGLSFSFLSCNVGSIFFVGIVTILYLGFTRIG